MTAKLDAEHIRKLISAPTQEQNDTLEVFAEIESTNSYLMGQQAPTPGRFRVALAEHQTAGRGRMERRWHSPGRTGLCLSMCYTFARRPELLSCLTLTIGVGVVEALERLGVHDVGLKWPNDLVFQDGKLGGILTEVKPGAGNEVAIVTGVGINYDLRDSPDARQIVTRLGNVSDLASNLQELPSRNRLAAALIDEIFNAFADFATDGFGNTAAAWERHDWLRGQKVSVDQGEGQLKGVCQGIDADGALILLTGAGRRRITSGSVSFAGESGGVS